MCVSFLFWHCSTNTWLLFACHTLATISRVSPWLSVLPNPNLYLVYTALQQILPRYLRLYPLTGLQLVQELLLLTQPLRNHAKKTQLHVKQLFVKRIYYKSWFYIFFSYSSFWRGVFRIKSIPSRIAFEIALFPNNLPLPTQKISARIIGGTIHFLHFWILASHDNDEGWDSVSGIKNNAWFDWVSTLLSPLLPSSCIRLSLVYPNHPFSNRPLLIQHLFPCYPLP